MDLNLTNSQTPIVVNSNTTALNDRNYTVVANATFTDPTPVEGTGFKVFVRNGTAVIGGTSYTVGSEIIRIFHSGSWANYRLDATDKVTSNAPITGATKTKVTYDSKGLVTGGADATTADIADSTNKRYVTDAQLTVIGNTSGTNTGDETNITILSKLNFFEYRNSANGTAVTGTTAEVIVDSILIPAGTFSSGSGFLDAIFKADKSGANAGWGMRLYIGPNNNNLTGATRIAINGLNTATLYAPIRRIFDTTSTQLKGFPFSAQAITDDNSSTTAKSTLTVDWTINQYLMPTLILTSGSDSCNLSSVHLKNF